jgi:DNA-binding beta-propeller fold protein YncE
LQVAPNGDVCIEDYWNMRIECVRPDGTFDFEFGFRGGKTSPGSLNFAWSFAIQPGTGYFYVANRESNDIVVFDQNGVYKTQWGKRGTACGQFNFPQGIAFEPNGTLVVADTVNGRIETFSIPASTPDDPNPADYQGINPQCYGQKGRKPQGPGFLNAPTGVSVGADGTIWVADTNNSSIQSLSPGGTWTRYINKGGKPFKHPQGVTVAPDGNVWVSNSGLNDLIELTPAGSQIQYFTGTSLGAGNLKSPFGVAFAPNGEVYVSDSGNDRVIALAP